METILAPLKRFSMILCQGGPRREQERYIQMTEVGKSKPNHDLELFGPWEMTETAMADLFILLWKQNQTDRLFVTEPPCFAI